MTPKIGDIMREVRNYFQYASVTDAWTITAGRLQPDVGLQPGTWVAVSGSARNDGVYQLGEDQLLPDSVDERFHGTVWQLAPSAEFLALCGHIGAWCAAQPADGVRRESFGGYSRELFAAQSGEALTWQQRFRRELQPYRRMYPGVRLGC